MYGSTICLYIAPRIYSLMLSLCSSTPDSFYSSYNGLIKMGHFRRFSCVRVRVRHVLDALIRALIGAQTMMVVVARSLSFTFALFLSLPSVLILCVCYLLSSVLCVCDDPIARSLLLSVHLWLSQHKCASPFATGKFL